MAASPSKQPDSLLHHFRAAVAVPVPPSARICVGLSGGLDSVVLLHLAAQMGWRDRLSALHVHHGLSPHADAWADFCLAYGAALGVPVRVVRVAVAQDGGLGVEAAARQARYEAFLTEAADIFLLAHHRDDQAETVLFNLLRGGGVIGAAGMPFLRAWQGRTLLRPLLGLGRDELLAYARAESLAWVEDESNADCRYSRNFLRHRILPLLAERFPASRSLAAAASHFAEADGLLAELAAMDWQACAEGDALAMRRLRLLSEPRLKNLLRYRLRQLGWRSPVASRLNEFARQLRTAAPDTHPVLTLPDGEMRVQGGCLWWVASGGKSA